MSFKTRSQHISPGTPPPLKGGGRVPESDVLPDSTRPSRVGRVRSHHGATEVLDERVIPQLARIMQTMGWELDEAGHLAPTKEENHDGN